ncbi:hypothetical protein [Amycolatopsis keratiniphila]|uniref:Uncharacterized protein n=1 Tax=Amycolatopsis keratiniphila TaxID=129921 RepID=R4TIS9_9PSEU|nr:hypothetical protein [Amycolatopsis keratiniphila]AGM10138.1 hypothetical protein AORI_7556 [Amycolatopsis keratiniphila]
MSSFHYRETASAPGVWAHELHATAPLYPLAEVVDEIAELTGRTGVPMTAYALTTGHGSSWIRLVRDPSVSHGTPDPDDCERAARELVAGGRWRSGGRLVRSAVMVAVGLREGYAPGNRLHTYDAYRTLHERARSVWSGMPVELISARLKADGTVRTYREPGVVTICQPDDLPVHATIAHAFAQRRFVVHDWLADHTTAFGRVAPEATR